MEDVHKNDLTVITSVYREMFSAECTVVLCVFQFHLKLLLRLGERLQNLLLMLSEMKRINVNYIMLIKFYSP